MKNQAVSRMRFWSVFGRPQGSKMETASVTGGSLLATIFHQKSKKGAKGSPSGAKSLKKRHLKIDVKNCIENEGKVCQKVPKMMPKWSLKSLIFHAFSKKAKMHETIVFIS